MLPDAVLDRFAQQCPAAVMVRATLENLLSPGRLDDIFRRSARRQYHKRLLFSELVALVAGVATREHASVHAAYLDARDRLSVSPAAVYAKLNRLEPGVSRALVRETAAASAAAIDALPGAGRDVLEGVAVHYLDGNHLSVTQRRLAPLRPLRGGPLPGKSLALLDARRGLIVDLVPCEDGHAQERSLVPQLLEHVPAGAAVVADRNFCTAALLLGLIDRGAFAVVREHAKSPAGAAAERPRVDAGRCETGRVFEQETALDRGGEAVPLRRVTVELDVPTEDGDTAIHLLTNLPADRVPAAEVARVYRGRWTVESAFQTLTQVLRCEVETLGYPRAALFSFAAAVLAWNTYAVVKAALRAAHGAGRVDEGLSDHHLVRDVVAKLPGLEVAAGDAAWARYRGLTPAGLAAELLALARRIDLTRYPKKKRGPKKPWKRRTAGSRNHVSTAKILKAMEPAK